MRRALVVLIVLVGTLASAAVAQSPSFQKDPDTDGRGKADLVRVALGHRDDGRLRAELTLDKPWTTEDLRAASGPSGSICLQLWARRVPGDEPPDYLVCATPAPTGERLRGRVLRDRTNGLPRQVGVARVTRPTKRTVYLRFAPKAIDRRSKVRFAGEVVTRAAKCPRVLGCRDTAPDAPATRNLTLRSASASG